MGESLMGLEFKNFDDIPDFYEKLTEFLNGLDEELRTWRDYVEKDGKRSIPHPITGIACLDEDKIVGIDYFTIPKKLGIGYIKGLLFNPKGVEVGSVVKKEYQRRGIAKYLWRLKKDLMTKMGYTRFWSRVDTDNIILVKWAERGGWKVDKRTDEHIFFAGNHNDPEKT